MSVKHELPIVAAASRDEWATWLTEQHATSSGVWLNLAKKGSGVASVTYAEAVEVALCFGWIDGQARSRDNASWLQRFTPRRSKSKWSKINCQRATELIERGMMQPAGLRAVEAAKADGRWEAAYDAPSTATVPDDLRRALDANDAANTYFATLTSQNRYAILHRIQDAKKPETRARRIEQYVTMLGEHRTIYP